jgi:urate oxidase
MYTLTNGINKGIAFKAEAIENEASFDKGMTSLVIATDEHKNTVTISQHECGDWDISVNGETVDMFDAEDGKEATQKFVNILKQGIDNQ